MNVATQHQSVYSCSGYTLDPSGNSLHCKTHKVPCQLTTSIITKMQNVPGMWQFWQTPYVNIMSNISVCTYLSHLPVGILGEYLS